MSYIIIHKLSGPGMYSNYNSLHTYKCQTNNQTHFVCNKYWNDNSVNL